MMCSTLLMQEADWNTNDNERVRRPGAENSRATRWQGSHSGCERDATEGHGQQRVAETPEHGGFQAGRLIIGSYCSLLCHL